jgi:methionine synthase / methylenetetrahydrofolate reductase(NADPH)
VAEAQAFVEHLGREVLIGDGAMGLYLHAKGIPLEANFERLNVARPDIVREAHEEYLEAGARVVETNTFGANRNKLTAAGLGDETARINEAGAQLARQAAGPAAYVLGSVGPTGNWELGEEVTPEDAFAEQLAALRDGGVDGFIIETFGRLDELVTAVRAARAVCDLPIVAQMTASTRRRVGSDSDPAHIARSLEALGVDVIGVNCGPGGPAAALRAVRAMSEVTARPISVFANASFARYIEGRLIYASNADYFADTADEMAAAGANLVGGCCGTTPEHIRHVAGRIAGRAPTARASAPAVAAPAPMRRKAKAPRVAIKGPPAFLSANAKPVNIIVEVDPPRGIGINAAVSVAAELKRREVNAVSIAENQLASVRMSSWALSHLVQKETGLTAICHCTCRDRNLIGQQSELMGGYVLGINHVLAITGDPISLGGGEGTSVFDTNSFGLIDMLSRMNRGENMGGESIGRPTSFTIGCALNPNRARMDGEIRRLEKKAALGATYAMTQPPEDAARTIELREKTRAMAVAVFVGIVPLISGRNADFLHNEVPGFEIPKHVRRRMYAADDPEAEGVAIAREYVDMALDAGFRHIYIIPMLRRYEMAYELVDYIREREGTLPCPD